MHSRWPNPPCERSTTPATSSTLPLPWIWKQEPAGRLFRHFVLVGRPLGQTKGDTFVEGKPLLHSLSREVSGEKKWLLNALNIIWHRFAEVTWYLICQRIVQLDWVFKSFKMAYSCQRKLVSGAGFLLMKRTSSTQTNYTDTIPIFSIFLLFLHMTSYD